MPKLTDAQSAFFIAAIPKGTYTEFMRGIGMENPTMWGRAVGPRRMPLAPHWIEKVLAALGPEKAAEYRALSEAPHLCDTAYGAGSLPDSNPPETSVCANRCGQVTSNDSGICDEAALQDYKEAAIEARRRHKSDRDGWLKCESDLMDSIRRYEKSDKMQAQSIADLRAELARLTDDAGHTEILLQEALEQRDQAEKENSSLIDKLNLQSIQFESLRKDEAYNKELESEAKALRIVVKRQGDGYSRRAEEMEAARAVINELRRELDLCRSTTDELGAPAEYVTCECCSAVLSVGRATIHCCNCPRDRATEGPQPPERTRFEALVHTMRVLAQEEGDKLAVTILDLAWDEAHELEDTYEVSELANALHRMGEVAP